MGEGHKPQEVLWSPDPLVFLTQGPKCSQEVGRRTSSQGKGYRSKGRGPRGQLIYFLAFVHTSCLNLLSPTPCPLVFNVGGSVLCQNEAKTVGD